MWSALQLVRYDLNVFSSSHLMTKKSFTAQLYVLNERLYKYILPFTPKFPQDFQGPLVDKYIALKFREMEEKLKMEKDEKAAQREKDGENSEKHEEEEEIDSEEDDGGTVEGENELPQQLIQEEPQHSVESTTKAQQQHADDSTEKNSLTSTTIVYEHEEDLQSIEPHVEIKNVGASGHLSHSIWFHSTNHKFYIVALKLVSHLMQIMCKQL